MRRSVTRASLVARPAGVLREVMAVLGLAALFVITTAPAVSGRSITAPSRRAHLTGGPAPAGGGDHRRRHFVHRGHRSSRPPAPSGSHSADALSPSLLTRVRANSRRSRRPTTHAFSPRRLRVLKTLGHRRLSAAAILGRHMSGDLKPLLPPRHIRGVVKRSVRPNR